MVIRISLLFRAAFKLYPLHQLYRVFNVRQAMHFGLQTPDVFAVNGVVEHFRHRRANDGWRQLVTLHNSSQEQALRYVGIEELVRD